MATSRISFSNSDDEVSYSTISTAPPKRRAGRTKFRETRHPIYKGVRLRNSNRWVCEVREPNKKSRIWLGTFQTADMAARAHDVAAMALRGKSACLNFADSPKLLRVPESTSPRSIQRAAAMAAEMFRPKSGNERNEVVLAEALQIDPFLEGFEFGEKDYADMAHGMLIDLPPPPVELAVEDGSDADEAVSLWNYSL